MGDKIEFPIQVPIVGQPLELLHWFPTVIVRCRCDMTVPKLIIFRDFDMTVKCPNCTRLYVLQGIDPNRNPIIGMQMPQLVS